MKISTSISGLLHSVRNDGQESEQPNSPSFGKGWQDVKLLKNQ